MVTSLEGDAQAALRRGLLRARERWRTGSRNSNSGSSATGPPAMAGGPISSGCCSPRAAYVLLETIRARGAQRHGAGPSPSGHNPAEALEDRHGHRAQYPPDPFLFSSAYPQQKIFHHVSTVTGTNLTPNERCPRRNADGGWGRCARVSRDAESWRENPTENRAAAASCRTRVMELKMNIWLRSAQEAIAPLPAPPLRHGGRWSRRLLASRSRTRTGGHMPRRSLVQRSAHCLKPQWLEECEFGD